MKFVEEFKKVQGTKWDVALTVAHHMDPPPDVIFFMADGTGGNEPDPIIEVNKLKGRPVINTIAMQTSRGRNEFFAMSEASKGVFTVVDKDGKPIDGIDYIKEPEKFEDRLN